MRGHREAGMRRARPVHHPRPVDRPLLLRPCGGDVSRTSDGDGNARARAGRPRRRRALRRLPPRGLRPAGAEHHMSAFTTRPELSGTFGMVASTHGLASAAGMAVLEQGGNAFDAAVAAGLALQVVEPHLNGPGGDAPILLWGADRGEPVVVCGQGPAPAAATILRFRELGLELVPGTG